MRIGLWRSWLLVGSMLWVISSGCAPRQVPTTTRGTAATLAAPSATLPLSPAPRDVLNRGIAAVGGLANARKLARTRFAVDGLSMAFGPLARPYSGQIKQDLPDRLVEVAEYGIPGQPNKPEFPKTTYTVVLDRDKGWQKLNAALQPMDLVARQVVLDQLHVNWVLTLAPLHDDSQFRLTAVSQKIVDGNVANGMRVEYPERRPLTLYFAQATGLPVKVETRFFDPNEQRERDQEFFVKDYTEANGVKYFTRQEVYNDGNQFLRAVVKDWRLVEQFDPKDFAQP